MKASITPEIDYRKLFIGELRPEKVKHILLLLYWPIYGSLFLFVEKYYRPESYYSVHCALDDLIPFCEIFLIPYLFWFIYLIGMHVYTLIYDITAFKRMMYFIMITYSTTIIIYLLFPTCQELRPAVFEENNILTRFMAHYYAFDTNTNVCPSIHVIGSFAVMLTAFHCKGFDRWTKLIFAVSGILIAISTVFVKQHSAIDILVALPICAVAYIVCFQVKRPDTDRGNRNGGRQGKPSQSMRGAVI